MLSTAPFSARSGHTWKGRCVPSIGGWPPRPHSHRPPHEDDASGRRARVGASTALRRAWQGVWVRSRNGQKRGTCVPTTVDACYRGPTSRGRRSAGTLSPGTAYGGGRSLALSARNFVPVNFMIHVLRWYPLAERADGCWGCIPALNRTRVNRKALASTTWRLRAPPRVRRSELQGGKSRYLAGA